MADVVVNLRDGRPIWALPDWAVEELLAAMPPEWEIHVADAPTSGSGDGAASIPSDVLRAVNGARIYMGFGVPASVLEVGRGTLEWVHSGAAGVGGSLHEEMLGSPARFTNSAGIHGAPIAETVVGMLLYFARGFDFAVAAGGRGEWDPSAFEAADSPVQELASMTVGILGYGGIGREVGRRVRALGAPVLGLKRGPPPAPQDDLGVTLLHGEEGLARLLADSDALVLAAPDTPETRGVLSEERIRSLREGAVVVNVARGALLDENGLLRALQDGHLRGAGLDVFSVEPLPSGHPLWSLPNVLITPHTSAVTRGFWRREMDLILGNLRHFLDGGSLVNEVDRRRGY